MKLFYFFLFSFFLILLFAIMSSAQLNETNLTITSKIPTCERNDTIKIFKEVLNATEIERYIKDVENLYNNCSLDFVRAENCPAAWLELKDHNKNLALERDNLIKENGKLRGFEISFYIACGILVILAITLIIKSFK